MGAQVCPTLYDYMDCSLPNSSVLGVFQARIVEWVAISFPGDLPDPGIEPTSSVSAGGFFTTVPCGKPLGYSRLKSQSEIRVVGGALRMKQC